MGRFFLLIFPNNQAWQSFGQGYFSQILPKTKIEVEIFLHKVAASAETDYLHSPVITEVGNKKFLF